MQMRNVYGLSKLKMKEMLNLSYKITIKLSIPILRHSVDLISQALLLFLKRLRIKSTKILKGQYLIILHCVWQSRKNTKKQ